MNEFSKVVKNECVSQYWKGSSVKVRILEFIMDEYLDTREFLLEISSQNEESIFVEHKYSIPLGGDF